MFWDVIGNNCAMGTDAFHEELGTEKFSQIFAHVPCECRPSSVTRVVLESVTIVLPSESFNSLYSLAFIGGVSKLKSARIANHSMSGIMDPALDRISVFNVKRFVCFLIFSI